MDGGVSDEQANAWLQDVADSSYISLHFESPGLQGTVRGEIAGGGYARFKMSWTQPSNRTIWSLVDARFTGLLQNRLTHFGVWDSLTGGMLRAYGPLPDMVTIINGQGYILHESELAVSIG